MGEMSSMEAFLSHRATDRSGGFLGNWKKHKKVNVFLHTKMLPVSIYRHGVPKVVVREEQGETVRHVWGGNYVCTESEEVNKKQYKRKDNGERVMPPERCPICKLIEEVRDMVEDGSLEWTSTLFRFDADDPKETQILHAGGMYGAYGDDKLTDDEKKELKEAGIYIKDSFKENCQAKLSYVFAVVDAEHPESGVQIAVETGLVGDKVKDVISDAITSMGSDKGNPQKNPYCIQWEYLEEEKAPHKKYKARKMDNIPLTPAIEKLIKGEKPDLEQVQEPPDPRTLRAILERACVSPEVRAKIPWDRIFAKAPAEKKAEAPKDEGATRVAEPSDADESVAAAEEDEECLCEDTDGTGCGKVIKLSDPKCPHCGKVYDVEAAAKLEPPKPVEPPKRSRSAARRKDGAKDGSGPTQNNGGVPF